MQSNRIHALSTQRRIQCNCNCTTQFVIYICFWRINFSLSESAYKSFVRRVYNDRIHNTLQQSCRDLLIFAPRALVNHNVMEAWVLSVTAGNDLFIITSLQSSLGWNRLDCILSANQLYVSNYYFFPSRCRKHDAQKRLRRRLIWEHRDLLSVYERKETVMENNQKKNRLDV